jgi:hypothetical protein
LLAHQIFKLILQKNKPQNIITLEQHRKIYNIFIKYSYPSCTNIKNIISEAEKESIINDEYNLINLKIKEINDNIILYQIPRIIYDLYNMYVFNSDKKKFMIDLHVLDNISNINEYCDKIYQFYFKSSTVYTDYNDDEIFMNTIYLNNFLISEYIEYISLIDNDNILTIWKHIMLDIIKKIGSYNFKINSNRNKFIFYKILLLEIGYILNDGLIYDPNNPYTLEINIKDIEKFRICSIYPNNKSLFLLYKGDKDLNETYSKSYYNSSILNGLIYDNESSTLEDYKEKFFKNYYILKKFFRNYGYPESNLFFIPPLLPFLQLYGKGEKWHPRLLISKETDSINNPDFYKSNLGFEELNKLYNNYIIKHRFEIINKYLQKYIKYKKKYIKNKK